MRVLGLRMCGWRFMFSDVQLQVELRSTIPDAVLGTEPLSYHFTFRGGSIKLVSYAKHMDTVKQLEYCQES